MGELKIAYSDKKVTPWGGMKLLKDFIDHLQILPYLNELNIPQPNSNRGYCQRCYKYSFIWSRNISF